MAQSITYINFSGNTREAMSFYKDCFGGDLELMPIAGSPIAGDMPENMKEGILHSSLTSGNIRLMASDMGCMDPNVKVGNNISITLDCESEEEINRLFNNLSAGGTVNQPVENAFWGGLFGQLTDKFGINWMLNCQQS